jgi:hypothetical protein
MSDPITNEERLELVFKVERLHELYHLDDYPNFPNIPVGAYVIEHVSGVGVWIYNQGGKQVFSPSSSNSHANQADPVGVRAVLNALRQRLVLEDLADV